MNIIHVNRLNHDDQPTIGITTVNGRFLCFCLEDRYRKEKVAGDTRIPQGTYTLRWREAGSWAARFKKRGLPGSLELCDVPGFTDILVHYGNTHDDTAGCLLMGMGADLGSRSIQKSRIAVNMLYQIVAEKDGWQVEIE